jgi:hypothetical protein
MPLGQRKKAEDYAHRITPHGLLQARGGGNSCHSQPPHDSPPKNPKQPLYIFRQPSPMQSRFISTRCSASVSTHASVTVGLLPPPLRSSAQLGLGRGCNYYDHLRPDIPPKIAPINPRKGKVARQKPTRRNLGTLGLRDTLPDMAKNNAP